MLTAASAPQAADRLVAAIEADPAITVAVLRLANRGRGVSATASVAAAVQQLPVATFAALAASVPVCEMLHGEPPRASRAARFRQHAIAVRVVTDVITARMPDKLDEREADECATVAILHDVGKLALGSGPPPAEAATPEERAGTERVTEGRSHADVGGSLARGWRLPERLAESIAHHHDAIDGPAAVVRLADMLVHFAADRPVDLDAMVAVAQALGLDRTALAELLYELPEPMQPPRRSMHGSPLSFRETEVLRLLATGMSGKQAARELGIAESTIRNHLHRIYSRIGAADRAQAILRAVERGWI
jgi:DNA-binding CsgD family transcriptional regulator/HD-like signal output (HDOD) protein